MASILIRDVSESVHEDLKRRAAQRGMSLGAYLLDVLEHETRGPSTRDRARIEFARWRDRHGHQLERADIVAEVRQDRDDRR